MTPEQRIDRAERMLILFVKAGRRGRSEWRKESSDQAEKIDSLINAQIATEDQLKRTDEQIKRTDEQIKKTGEQIAAFTARTDVALDRLAASQAKTEETLQRFINSLNKSRNGNSEN